MLRTECDLRGIDYSHFATRSWSDDELRLAIGNAQSWPDLLDSLGLSKESGSARASVRKHAVRLGLDTTALSEPPGPRLHAFTAVADLANLRAAGPYIVAGACALVGYKVSWPLEPAVYDLLVDTGTIQRVQVKTTTCRVNGTWACKITHSERSKPVRYSASEIDYFGVVDPELHVYMIPIDVLQGLTTIYLRRYDGYRFPREDT